MVDAECLGSPTQEYTPLPSPSSPPSRHIDAQEIDIDHRDEDEDEDNWNGDFARLVPMNWEAKVAFSEVVDQLREQVRTEGVAKAAKIALTSTSLELSKPKPFVNTQGTLANSKRDVQVGQTDNTAAGELGDLNSGSGKKSVSGNYGFLTTDSSIPAPVRLSPARITGSEALAATWKLKRKSRPLEQGEDVASRSEALTVAECAARHLQYMHIRPEKEKRSQTEISFSSDIESEPKALEEDVWSGYYRLNMDIIPANYRMGWVVGRGRQDIPNRGVEFLIDTNSRSRVSGRHGRLVHNEDGILLIRSDTRLIVMDGKEQVFKTSRALVSPTTALGFGKLTFRLEFTSLPRYPQQLAAMRKKQGNLSSHAAFLDPTPSSNDYLLKEYIMKAPFASGSTCIVLSGLHRSTGKPVAIKRMKRVPANFQLIQREVQFLQKLNHPCICQLITHFFVSSVASIDEAYFIYPLAESQLQDIITKPKSLHYKLSIFRQTLEALIYLHDSQKIMHRDIKPQNIVLLRTTPVQAQLIDFGSASHDEFSFDHTVGTIRYLAPEVIALKTQAATPVRDRPALVAYSRMIDLWSLGLTMGELFLGRWLATWARIDRGEYVELKKRMGELWIYDRNRDEEQMLGSVGAVVDDMISWAPTSRVSARECLDMLDGYK